nr:hypothetical protein [uncultured Moellerella sp.]
MYKSGVDFANKNIQNIYQIVIDEVDRQANLINEINQGNRGNYKSHSQWLDVHSNALDRDRFLQGFISTINPLVEQLKVPTIDRSAIRSIRWETKSGAVSVIMFKSKVEKFIDSYQKLIEQKSTLKRDSIKNIKLKATEILKNSNHMFSFTKDGFEKLKQYNSDSSKSIKYPTSAIAKYDDCERSFNKDNELLNQLKNYIDKYKETSYLDVDTYNYLVEKEAEIEVNLSNLKSILPEYKKEKDKLYSNTNVCETLVSLVNNQCLADNSGCLLSTDCTVYDAKNPLIISDIYAKI